MIRQALIVAQKEGRHLTRDRLALTLTLALPLFQLILYGYALDTRIRNVPAAILNRDVHQGGRVLTQRISRSPLFAVKNSYHSTVEMQAALRAGSIRVAIEVPESYTADLVYRRKPEVRVWLDGSNVVTSNYILSALETVAYREASEAAGVRFHSMDVVPVVDIGATVLFNPEGRTTVFLIPGLIALLVQMVTTLLIALSITAERENGTLERLAIAGVRTNAIVTGKCAAIACVGLVECASLVLLMRWLFGIPVSGGLGLLVAVAPLLVLAPLGIGLLIAARARTHAHVLQLTHLVFFPSVMLSGFIVPREFLTSPVGWAGNLLPATYLVDLSRSIIVRGASLAEIAPTILAAAAASLVLLLAGYWAMNKRALSS